MDKIEFLEISETGPGNILERMKISSKVFAENQLCLFAVTSLNFQDDDTLKVSYLLVDHYVGEEQDRERIDKLAEHNLKIYKLSLKELLPTYNMVKRSLLWT
ncbi:hypothetical protein HZY83_02420 [Gemella sp. GH3]|uniref:hypothetical protein n=1 Tax=unclassified Gemella TaxID=2624949 RepID=UPI0015D06BE1|nr:MULTISPECIES: hypothetical protein [unclassified Gemella]MBF0713541.1 hypothetical protein [Gemella sp. GH3.1]NYS50493.1 hypothetical protein [Gemella sp. GH3]